MRLLVSCIIGRFERTLLSCERYLHRLSLFAFIVMRLLCLVPLYVMLHRIKITLNCSRIVRLRPVGMTKAVSTLSYRAVGKAKMKASVTVKRPLI